MPYVIEKLEEKFLDAVASPEGWVARDPGYAQLFDDNQRLRNYHAEPGPKIKVPEWKHVARMPSTLLDVLRQMSPDGVHLDKKRFYPWLNRNKQYAAYDVKGGR